MLDDTSDHWIDSDIEDSQLMGILYKMYNNQRTDLVAIEREKKQAVNARYTEQMKLQMASDALARMEQQVMKAQRQSAQLKLRLHREKAEMKQRRRSYEKEVSTMRQSLEHTNDELHKLRETIYDSDRSAVKELEAEKQVLVEEVNSLKDLLEEKDEIIEKMNKQLSDHKDVIHRSRSYLETVANNERNHQQEMDKLKDELHRLKRAHPETRRSQRISSSDTDVWTISHDSGSVESIIEAKKIINELKEDNVKQQRTSRKNIV